MLLRSDGIGFALKQVNFVLCSYSGRYPGNVVEQKKLWNDYGEAPLLQRRGF
jgi:hypothetical protein